VFFGHVSIGLVYGMHRLYRELVPVVGYSSLLYSSLAFIPGATLIAIGKVSDRYWRHLEAREAAEEAREAAEAAQKDQAEHPGIGLINGPKTELENIQENGPESKNVVKT
jgi:hypothetical protein